MNMDNQTDPVIQDLLKWLKENLPPESDDEAIFKKVRRVQKVFDTLIGLTFEEFYNNAMSIQHKQFEQRKRRQKQGQEPQQKPQSSSCTKDDNDEVVDEEQEENEAEEEDDGEENVIADDDDCSAAKAPATMEEAVSQRLDQMKEYLSLNDERRARTAKLNMSRSKLDLKKQQYQLIKSIRLDGCLDLISRYNHLMTKK